MELGKNEIVDDISATHLDRLRDQLGAVLRQFEPDAPRWSMLIDAVMYRAAEQMHSAVTEAYTAGELL
jgi:hypothetical protein